MGRKKKKLMCHDPLIFLSKFVLISLQKKKKKLLTFVHVILCMNFIKSLLISLTKLTLMFSVVYQDV